MWQRFTERSRRVVFYAQEEAGKLGKNYLSTEHLLLGIVRERDCVAARLLEKTGRSVEQVRFELERHLGHSNSHVGQDMQLTPRAKRVIDLAYVECRKLDSNYIGTEHLLLGLVGEGEGLAGRVLVKLGVTLRRVREELLLLQENTARQQAGNELLTKATQNAWVASAYERIYGKAEPEKIVDEPVPEVAEKATPSVDRVRYALKLLRRTEPDLFQIESQSGLEERVADVVEKIVDPVPGDLGSALASWPNGVVEIALDTETFQALVAAYRAKDVYGYQQLTHDNQSLILVSDATPLKMLVSSKAEAAVVEAITANSMYVRVLGGAYKGYAGWMFADAFQREGSDNTLFPPPDNGGNVDTTAKIDSDEAA